MANFSVMGLGSSVLNSDTIEKLKANETNIFIKPIENKISKTKTQIDGLADYKNQIKDFSLTIKNLSDEMLYLKRKTTITNENILDANIENGTKTQNININVESLAKTDTYQSSVFNSKDIVINNSGTNKSLTINFQNKDYIIDVTNGMKLSELNDKINNTLNTSKLSSSLLKITDNNYSLVLSSNITGSDNKINISGDTEILNNLNFNNVQTAQNAKFTYNGLSVERSLNKFNDLVSGVDITLKSIGESTIKITNNLDSIKEQYKQFVTQYNALVDTTKVLTESSGEGGNSGIFSEMKGTFNNIFRNINRSLSEFVEGKNLYQYGLEMDRSGYLNLNDSKLNNLNFDEIEKLFSKEKGVFTKLNKDMDYILNTNSSFLNYFGKDLDIKYKKDQDNLVSTQEFINIRFQTMTNQFNAYDSMISKMNSNFSALQNIINQSYKDN